LCGPFFQFLDHFWCQPGIAEPFIGTETFGQLLPNALMVAALVDLLFECVDDFLLLEDPGDEELSAFACPRKDISIDEAKSSPVLYARLADPRHHFRNVWNFRHDPLRLLLRPITRG
jgi:hypothetical protein